MRVADIVRDIKNNSSNFINDHKFVKGNFSWQDGCGAFSYSHSQIDKVYKYILKQEKHHKKRTFNKIQRKVFVWMVWLAFRVAYFHPSGVSFITNCLPIIISPLRGFILINRFNNSGVAGQLRWVVAFIVNRIIIKNSTCKISGFFWAI